MKTVWYVKNTLAKCNEDAYLPSLPLSTVELRCKLRENLHRVTWHGFNNMKIISVLYWPASILWTASLVSTSAKCSQEVAWYKRMTDKLCIEIQTLPSHVVTDCCPHLHWILSARKKSLKLQYNNTTLCYSCRGQEILKDGQCQYTLGARGFSTLAKENA